VLGLAFCSVYSHSRPPACFALRFRLLRPLQFVGAFRIVDAEATVPVTPNINPSTGKM
jgi:hypothetical protein